MNKPLRRTFSRLATATIFAASVFAAQAIAQQSLRNGTYSLAVRSAGTTSSAIIADAAGTTIARVDDLSASGVHPILLASSAVVFDPGKNRVHTWTSGRGTWSETSSARYSDQSRLHVTDSYVAYEFSSGTRHLAFFSKKTGWKYVRADIFLTFGETFAIAAHPLGGSAQLTGLSSTSGVATRYHSGAGTRGNLPRFEHYEGPAHRTVDAFTLTEWNNNVTPRTPIYSTVFYSDLHGFHVLRDQKSWISKGVDFAMFITFDPVTDRGVPRYATRHSPTIAVTLSGSQANYDIGPKPFIYATETFGLIVKRSSGACSPCGRSAWFYSSRRGLERSVLKDLDGTFTANWSDRDQVSLSDANTTWTACANLGCVSGTRTCGRVYPNSATPGLDIVDFSKTPYGSYTANPALLHGGRIKIWGTVEKHSSVKSFFGGRAPVGLVLEFDPPVNILQADFRTMNNCRLVTEYVSGEARVAVHSSRGKIALTGLGPGLKMVPPAYPKRLYTVYEPRGISAIRLGGGGECGALISQLRVGYCIRPVVVRGGVDFALRFPAVPNGYVLQTLSLNSQPAIPLDAIAGGAGWSLYQAPDPVFSLSLSSGVLNPSFGRTDVNGHAATALRLPNDPRLKGLSLVTAAIAWTAERSGVDFAEASSPLRFRLD